MYQIVWYMALGEGGRVEREEENREMDNDGVGMNSWYVRGMKLSW